MGEFGDALKAIREKNGWTLDEMAKRLNTTKQALSRYERGERTPKITIAAKFAEILNVDLSELIGYEYHDSEPNFLDASIGEDLSRFTADDYHLLEELHKDPDLRTLLDRYHWMSEEDRKKLIHIAGVFIGELN